MVEEWMLELCLAAITHSLLPGATDHEIDVDVWGICG